MLSDKGAGNFRTIRSHLHIYDIVSDRFRFFLKKHITFQSFCNQIVSCNCQIWENYILSGVFLYLHACLVLVKCNLESPEISIVLVVYMLERMVQGLRPESSAVSVC